MDRFGVYAYCGFDLPADERFRRVKEAGFSKVGVWCHSDYNTYSGISEYEQFKFVKEQGLAVSYAHAPTAQTAYLSNKYYGAREVVKMHKVYVKSAAEQGVRVVVMHLPEVKPIVIDHVAEIASFGEDMGVKVAVENLTGKTPFDELFAAVENVYFCYDTCHALMFGDKDGEMATRYMDRLVTTHLSDGDGKSDCHYMIGDGVFDFNALAKRLREGGYRGDLVLEAFRSAEYADISEFLSTGKARLETIFG